MSFQRFIYYCAIIGGWAAFVGWVFGAWLSPKDPGQEVPSAGIKGMFLGMVVALGLSLLDGIWNLSARPFIITQRVGVAVLVGCVGGLLGGVVGQLLFSLTKSGVFYVLGWTITGLLIGVSIGVYELLLSVITQKDVSGATKKLMKGLIGGTVGGVLGAVLSLVFRMVGPQLFSGKDADELWSPTAWGFVALGMCIGLLIGLAQVILKEAWIKIETGRKAGREMILTKEKTSVGRAEACDIGLFGDNQIEKLHAYIVQSGNRYYLEDMKTPGGTYVNDHPVAGRVALNSGDLIRVGGSVLCFRERQKH